MKHSRALLCALTCTMLCALLLATPVAHAQDLSPEETQVVAKAFIVKLKKAIEGDPAQLAPLMRFPLYSGVTRAQFLKNPRKVITPKVVACVREHNMDAEVFIRNMCEAMVGWGCVWFELESKDKVEIISVNP